MLIGGEAGGGKTRLAAEFARSCHDDGAAVLFGGCDAELVVPYQPWVQALDHLLRTLDPDDLDADVTPDLGVLAPLLPSLERASRPEPRSWSTPTASATGSSPRSTRCSPRPAGGGRSSSCSTTCTGAARRPGRCSATSLAGARTSRMLIVGTFRDVGDDVTDPLASSLADLRRVDTVDPRAAPRASTPTTSPALVARPTGHELDEPLRRLVGEVTTRTLGNAFFVGEMWHHLVATGVVDREGERWVVTRRHRRRRACPTASARSSPSGWPGSRSPSAAWPSWSPSPGNASSCGCCAWPPTCRTARSPPASTRSTTAGLLEAVERPMLAYQFTHALVRDTVEAGVPAAARAQLHLRVAEALESIHEGDPRPALAELARHYSEAAGLGVAPKAVYYCRRAAEQALASVAYEEALEHLRRAPRANADGTAARAELLRRDRRRPAAPEPASTSPPRHYEDGVPPRARARRGTGSPAKPPSASATRCTSPVCPGEPAVAMLSEAIRLVGDDGSALRAQLEAVLALALTHSGHLEAAHARARQRAALGPRPTTIEP